MASQRPIQVLEIAGGPALYGGTERLVRHRHEGSPATDIQIVESRDIMLC